MSTHTKGSSERVRTHAPQPQPRSGQSLSEDKNLVLYVSLFYPLHREDQSNTQALPSLLRSDVFP